MTIISILCVLFIEQFWPLRADNPIYGWIRLFAQRIELSFNAGRLEHGRLGWLVIVSVLVVPTVLIYWILALFSPLLQFLWTLAIVYLTLGFRHYSHYFTSIQLALNNGDAAEARKLLSEWLRQEVEDTDPDEIARLAVEKALITTHKNVFGVFFWLLISIGPAGAVLYRISEYLARAWNETESMKNEPFGRFAERAFYYIDWIPVRLTAVAFAIVGNFEDAAYAWRNFARRWKNESDGIILAVGGGAMGVRLGTPAEYASKMPDVDINEVGVDVEESEIMPGEPPSLRALQSTVGLIWRALLLWVLMLLLLSIAAWLG
jgi:adenosylcobinamide-phosphate synthase